MVGWGVMGASAHIAVGAVLPAIKNVERATLTAVASRRLDTAVEVGRAYGADRCYGTYASLLRDPDVDVVYICLPPALHVSWALECIGSGKSVVCEKPLGLSAREVDAVRNAASQTGVSVWEAFKPAFHPQTRRVVEVLQSDRLGTLLEGDAEYSIALPRDGGFRWSNTMGGGALLDLGQYCLYPFIAAIGLPENIECASSVVGQSGVDEMTRAVIRYRGGLVVNVSVSFQGPLRQSVEVRGTRRTMVGRFPWRPQDARCEVALVDGASGASQFLPVCSADPTQTMIESVSSALTSVGESPEPLKQTRALASVIDEIRSIAMR